MSTTPPTDPTPEYLDQDGATTAAGPDRAGRGPRRTAALALGALATLGLVGAGAWAATNVLATGDQPAEALPAGTLGYLAVDLDPGGSQKLAALRTLKELPAFADSVDLGSPDDLVSAIGEAAVERSGCALDHAEDVEPWLGKRFALAAVQTGSAPASPVAVLQVQDAAAAQDGLAALAACGDDDAGWAVEGDWAVLAESDEVAAQVLADAADSSLADDEDFARWTSEAGDPGVVSGYLAAGAGAYLAEELASDSSSDLPADTAAALEQFGGAAMTVRFDDGGLEVETAADSAVGALSSGVEGDQGGAATAALPADTAAALGVGLEPGWATAALDALRQDPDVGDDLDRTIARVERLTGLELPADVETLLGDSAVLSLGGDLDLGRLLASPDGSTLPVALSVQGEPAEVERVLEQVREAAGPAAGGLLGSRSDDGTVVVGPDAGYRADLLETEDGLGESDSFTRVVPEADRAATVLYLDVDAFDEILGQTLGAGSEVVANLTPLAAIGAAAWVDGDVSRSRLVLTTDD